jgi:hypothetical protein
MPEIDFAMNSSGVPPFGAADFAIRPRLFFCIGYNPAAKDGGIPAADQ